MAKSTRSGLDGLGAAGEGLIGRLLAAFGPQHRGDMQRFVLFIAILLAFSATAGLTTGHAHRYVSVPIVVLNHVNADNQPIPVMVHVQRGEIDLGAGIIMPCGSHYAVAVSAPCLPPAPDKEEIAFVLTKTAPASPSTKLLRPPIAA